MSSFFGREVASLAWLAQSGDYSFGEGKNRCRISEALLFCVKSLRRTHCHPARLSWLWYNQHREALGGLRGPAYD